MFILFVFSDVLDKEGINFIQCVINKQDEETWLAEISVGESVRMHFN